MAHLPNTPVDEFDPEDEVDATEEAEETRDEMYIYHQNLDADHIAIEVERNTKGFNYTVKLSGDPSDEAITTAVAKAKKTVELMEKALPKTT